ncbi:MAG: ComEC/Rec2 family competence protein [Flavobacteriales bacterium]|nr:ComEC/Rec2 family competence protein [Flavobacteriales bacterium]
MKFWQNHPGIRLVFPFILGIIAAAESQTTNSFAFYISITLLLFFGISIYFSRFQYRKLTGIIIHLLLFFVGFQYTIERTDKFKKTHYSNFINPNDYLMVKVCDNLEEKQNSYKTILEVQQISSDTNRIVSGKILAYFKKGVKISSINYGDELLIKNKLNEVGGARNPNQFNYKHYLNINQINSQVFLDSVSWQKTGVNSGNGLVAFSQRMRQKLYNYLSDNGIVGDQLKVASALLLGYRENLDKDLVKSYSSAGAMHVLAVSGLHVGILYLLLANLLKVFSKIKNSKIWIALILISILWFYALMTGMSASVMRSATMFTFIIIGDKIIDRKGSIYNTLAISALVLILINPHIIYQVGFQLSYSAVLGIVYVQPKLYKLIYVKNIFLQKVWAITCVSIAAQIATFPLSLHYFHQFPVYFFIINLIVIPAAIGIFYLGIFLFVTAPFGGLSLVIGKAMNGIIWVLNQAICITEKMAYSLIEEIAISFHETFLLYAIIISYLASLVYRKVRLVYVTGILTILFLGIQLNEQYQSTQQAIITFYSVNNETVFEFVSGKSTYFISSKKLKEDWSSMLFNVNNNWNNQNITNKIYLDIDSLPVDYQNKNLLIMNGVFIFNNKRIRLLNKSNINFKSADLTLVTKQNLKLINKLTPRPNEKIIFDSSIRPYKANYYLKYLDTTNIEIVFLDKKYYSVNLSD